VDDSAACVDSAWFALPSSISPINSSSCSTSRSSFSDERPKRARRSAASCAFRLQFFNMKRFRVKLGLQCSGEHA
jgi:hypothetical protein